MINPTNISANISATQPGAHVWPALSVSGNNMVATWTKAVRDGVGYSFSRDGGLTWSPPGSIPARTDYRPMLAAAANGNTFYCVWHEFEAGNVWFASFDITTGTWSAPRAATALRGKQPNSPAIAVKPDGSLWISYAVREDFGNETRAKVYLIVSRDGGVSWQDVPGWPQAVAWPSYNHISSMAVVDDRLVIAWCAEGRAVATAVERPPSRPDARWAIAMHSNGRCYWPLLIGGSGKLGLLWQENSGGAAEIYHAAYNSDLGNFGEAEQITSTPDLLEMCPTGGYDNAGRLVAAYTRRDETNRLRMILNSGGTEQDVSENVLRCERPYIAGGTLLFQGERGGRLNSIFALPLYAATPQPQPSPADNVTRGQFARLACEAWGIAPLPSPTPTFRDVPTTHPNYAYIEAAAAANIVRGAGDGNFLPNRYIRRDEMAIMIVRARGYAPPDPLPQSYPDVPPTHFAHRAIEALRAAGIMRGGADGLFRPSDNITHYEAGLVLARTIGGE